MLEVVEACGGAVKDLVLRAAPPPTTARISTHQHARRPSVTVSGGRPSCGAVRAWPIGCVMPAPGPRPRARRPRPGGARAPRSARAGAGVVLPSGRWDCRLPRAAGGWAHLEVAIEGVGGEPRALEREVRRRHAPTPHPLTTTRRPPPPAPACSSSCSSCSSSSHPVAAAAATPPTAAAAPPPPHVHGGAWRHRSGPKSSSCSRTIIRAIAVLASASNQPGTAQFSSSSCVLRRGVAFVGGVYAWIVYYDIRPVVHCTLK